MSILSQINAVTGKKDKSVLSALNTLTGGKADDIEEAFASLVKGGGGSAAKHSITVEIDLPEYAEHVQTIVFSPDWDNMEPGIPVNEAKPGNGCAIHVDTDTGYEVQDIVVMDKAAGNFVIPIEVYDSNGFFVMPSFDVAIRVIVSTNIT